MFKPTQIQLNEYATLAIKYGVNIQKGQQLVINAYVDAKDLARQCVKQAYLLGASRVTLNYLDDVKTRLDYEYVVTEELCNIPKWKVDQKQDEIDKNTCYLHIIGEDPDLLTGIDPNKISKANIAKMKALVNYDNYIMNSVGQWCVISYPNLSWAKKIYPNLDDDEALNSLWLNILDACRIDENKTLSNWDLHNKELLDYTKLLNGYNFKSLYFKNSLGTDLIVGLIKDHIWEGGASIATGKYKVPFNANIPSEEVFTMPDRFHIDGKVVSSKPLSYNGNIINKFELTFKDGQIIDYKADNNVDVLRNLIETDKGTKSLGEVALISYDSPINNTGILFYETLFDENASCHLAIGACYPTNIKNGENLTREELYELGGNDSLEHVDFMFGTKDLSVIGTDYDGRQIEIFKDGNFVI